MWRIPYRRWTRPRTSISTCGGVLMLLWLVLPGQPVNAAEAPAAKSPEAPAARPVDYTTQIRPLLATHCDRCHSAAKQESGLRLDTARLAIRGGDRGPAIIPGDSTGSLLLQSLLKDGEVSRMPAEGRHLTAAEIDLVRRWIDQGAKYPTGEVAAGTASTSDHWSFQPVRRPQVPAVRQQHRVQNAIDAFILRRLEQEGLELSPEATRETLIRRLSLDLRGLPPTLSEVDQFLADQQPGAWARLVDRMLDSPHFGERWGRHWLDVARYADSNGFTIDGPRSIWKYRDWVIDAYNRDLPFDRFVIEQLAGDMLPDPTTEQLIATGFHRNTLINQEGGTDREQFRVEAVVDRVNTTGSAFLGLTVGCAQCHAHKYDPISQREFYQLFAIFNNCDEPQIPIPTAAQQQQQQQLKQQIAALEQPLKARDAEYAKGMPAWEKQVASLPQISWSTCPPAVLASQNGSVLARQDDNSVFVDFSIPSHDTYLVTVDTPLDTISAIRLEALTHPALPKKGPGRASNGNFILSKFEAFVEKEPAADGAAPKDDALTPITLSTAIADHAQEGWPVVQTLDDDPQTGWAINVKSGSMNVDREAIYILSQPLKVPESGRLHIRLHHRHKDSGYLLGRFRISVTTGPPEALTTPESIRELAAIPADKRDAKQQQALKTAYHETDTERAPLAAELGRLKKQSEALAKAIPTTMILQERRGTARESFIHIRGDFLRKGAKVTGGVPAVLPQLPDDKSPVTRLDFARWLVDPANPLTSRVTVNRFWQRLFGRGLVRTEDDFGVQGTPPTHPELLDWLASEFMQEQWSVKQLLRTIVTSSVYRQSSSASEELLQRDPDNRLLARQSRLRLEAETIRDVALASSGLLSGKVGGPGVYPPQPEGIYVLTQVRKAWPESRGEDRYRRGMYTYFWRSSPYPLLPTFDAPEANTTCTRRSRSNTPLQALTLANDRAFLEFAAGLARRLLSEPAAEDSARLTLGVRLCLSREPSSAERDLLLPFVQRQRAWYGQHEAEAKKLIAAGGEAVPQSAPLPPAELAAWIATARVLLNLDEFITRN